MINKDEVVRMAQPDDYRNANYNGKTETSMFFRTRILGITRIGLS